MNTSVIILRCCRDWPCHFHWAYGTNGRCGICRQIPEVINKPYIKENYEENREGRNQEG